MPQAIETVDELQEYLVGVAGRADGHAPGVQSVILALAGAIVLFKDPGAELSILTREGLRGNVLWVVIGGERYALSYNHDDDTVEIRRRSWRGPVVARFDNNTTAMEVRRIFAELHAGGAGERQQ